MTADPRALAARRLRPIAPGIRAPRQPRTSHLGWGIAQLCDAYALARLLGWPMARVMTMLRKRVLSPRTVAHVARAIGTTPEEIDVAGRGESAA